jgi:hypothetical protein
MNIGYARVSTRDQNLTLQLDALHKAGCETIFQEQASGATKARPELERLLASLRPGDTVTIYKLDRLGRSLKHLLDMVAELEFRGVGLVSLTDAINTTSAQGRLVFNLFASGDGWVVVSGGSPKRRNARRSSPKPSTASSNSASMKLPSGCTSLRSRSINTCATAESSSTPTAKLPSSASTSPRLLQQTRAFLGDLGSSERWFPVSWLRKSKLELIQHS